MSLKYMGVPDRCRHGEYTDKLCDKCEIERLRGENAERRRLLREAMTVFSLGTDAEWSEWLNKANKAGEDDE